MLAHNTKIKVIEEETMESNSPPTQSPNSPFPEITIEIYYYHERKPWNCILYDMNPSN